MSLRVGDQVHDNYYGYEGTISKIDIHCKQPDEWVKAQLRPVTPEELDEQWVHVTITNRNGGAVVGPESRFTRIT